MSPGFSENYRAYAEQSAGEDVMPEVAVWPDLHSIVDARLNLFDPAEIDQLKKLMEKKDGPSGFRELFHYFTEKSDCSTAKGLRQVLVKVIAAMWVIEPGCLTDKHGKVLSLEELGKPIGVTRCWLSMVAEAFSEKFGVWSRNQKKQSSRVQYAKGAYNGWDTRRKKGTKGKAKRRA